MELKMDLISYVLYQTQERVLDIQTPRLFKYVLTHEGLQKVLENEGGP